MMPSIISSADDSAGRDAHTAGDGSAEQHHAIHHRQTASDRPGVAQPVPKRPVPDQPWGRIFAGMLLLLAGMLGAWEWHWRDFGVAPSIRNTDALWAIQRRRIDNGEGDATLIVASSRLFFDLQLDIWEKLDGKRPIQLAFEGTSPLPFLEDLAADPKRHVFEVRYLADRRQRQRDPTHLFDVHERVFRREMTSAWRRRRPALRPQPGR
jgi:hypothetical protein